MKKFIFVATTIAVSLLSQGTASAQSTSYWSQCVDGAAIVRCETYNCPKGDTNQDGLCDLKDTNATLSDTRNDSFCANPPSGCGQVLYYAQGTTASCAVRVKENDNSCNLYKAGVPNFSSPVPVSSPTPTPVSRLNASALPSTTPRPNSSTLPKTGAELWVSIFIAALGMYGLYLYEKPRKEQD